MCFAGESSTTVSTKCHTGQLLTQKLQARLTWWFSPYLKMADSKIPEDSQRQCSISQLNCGVTNNLTNSQLGIPHSITYPTGEWSTPLCHIKWQALFTTSVSQQKAAGGYEIRVQHNICCFDIC